MTCPPARHTSRVTTAVSTRSTCSTQTIAVPPSFTARIVPISDSVSGSLSPPAISSSSRTRGRMASARASSRRLRSSRRSEPAVVLAWPAMPVTARASYAAPYACRPRSPAARMAPTSAFSNTVRPPSGRGTWNVRPSPILARSGGASRVTSLPCSTTRPASHRPVPVSRSSRVVLPAPFGPTTPTASPGATASETEPSTDSEP